MFKIMRGCDKQCFPMKQGVLTSGSVFLLNSPRDTKGGDNDLSGMTDVEKPRMRGPKRASKIHKLFNLSKKMMSRICQLIAEHSQTKTGSKVPMIHSVTPLTLQRKRAIIADKNKIIAKANLEASEYLIVEELVYVREIDTAVESFYRG
ncbi:hypothetical protein L1887_11496 [Cichorium endivia]|nr:hypothetical protein L1887_11496 [Cichorium endivia]